MLGQALGVDDERFESIRAEEPDETVFNERELAVLRWTTAFTLNTAKRDKAAWEEMRRLFTDAEIVELSLASGLFNMINRLNDSFWTDLESEDYNRRQHGALEVSEQDLERYACDICHRSTSRNDLEQPRAGSPPELDEGGGGG